MRGLGIVKRCAVVNFLRLELTLHEISVIRHLISLVCSLLQISCRLFVCFFCSFTALLMS